MKDIAYYAGFLGKDDQQNINDASIEELINVLSDLVSDIHMIHGECTVFLRIRKPASDRDKIALIRGLCDRIELKLMETAK